MTTPIAVTTGDPAGIGPELVVNLLLELRESGDAIVVVSSRAELEAAIERAGAETTVDDLLSPEGFSLHELDGEYPTELGAVSVAGGAWALKALAAALELRARGEVGGLMFAPLNKASCHAAGMTEPDEMRWFENRFPGEHTVSEVNVNDSFWTSRVTSHVPLSEVAGLVTTERVTEATVLLDRLLRAAGREEPKLAVAALNPHAGEGGLFGHEEITAISPAVERVRAEGVEVSGPFPCDTIFRRGFDGTFDGIVTMYHDQGQIAMKTRAFDGGVTLEAGLPMPICTPAHGSAFDIVGKRVASLTSTRNAYRLVRTLAEQGAS